MRTCVHVDASLHTSPLSHTQSAAVCQFIEHMLTHPEKAPISKLREPCHHCLSIVHKELRSLGGQVASKSRLAHFPMLLVRVSRAVRASRAWPPRLRIY